MAHKQRMWAIGKHDAASLGGGVTQAYDLLSAYKTEVGVNELRGKTIGAVIGEIVFTKSAAVNNSLNTMDEVAFGIAVLPPGGTPPDPGTGTFPWMWYWDHWTVHLAVQVDATPNYRNVPIRLPMHIRAMRILTIGTSLFLVGHNYSGSALNVSFGGNVLLLG